MLKTTAFIVLLAVVGGSLAQEYCELCADHTMCIYPGIGECCVALLKKGTTSADEAFIVDAHNAFRARIAAGNETRGTTGAQPPAANMRKMVWDAELARVAQRWADQCDFGHDACRKVPRFGVGQNLFASGYTSNIVDANWTRAINSWFDEVEEFDRNAIAPYVYKSASEHYSQLAWAESYRVGCGFVRYEDGIFYNTYVCNYAPAGNVVAGSVYVKGAACSNCPTGTTCSNSLCV